MAAKNGGINCVVAREETRVAEVSIDLDHIAKGSAVSLENGGDVIDSPVRLLLNAVADQFSGTGSMGPVPDTKTKSPARHPWEYAPPGGAPRLL
jgi:hypothetical protein